MSPVTARDTLGGGSRVDSASSILNVNAGSRFAPADGASLLAAPEATDMTVWQGKIVTVHVEPDTTITMPWSTQKQIRGPYVHQWDGATLSLLGTNVDPATDAAPTTVGDRCLAKFPRIATDGTDLFVAYVDSVVTNIGTGDTVPWVRIAHWTGAAWVEVAAEQAVNTFGPTLELTVANGKAYALYYLNDSNRLRVLRSDGTAGFVLSSGGEHISYVNLSNLRQAAITTRTGRPVGFYQWVLNDAGALVMFDLDTLADIARTPTVAGVSALVPYGTNTQTGHVEDLAGGVALYGNDDIALGSVVHKLLRIQEAGAGGFTTIDGAEGASLAPAAGSIAEDTSDPSQLWLYGYNSNYQGPVNPSTIRIWEAACQSANVVGTPLNTTPYAPFDSGRTVPVPDAFTVPNPAFDATWGTSRLATIGNFLYCFYVYYPSAVSSPPPADQRFWTQFILYKFPISRGGAVCDDYITPLFGSRFKHHEADA